MAGNRCKEYKDDDMTRSECYSESEYEITYRYNPLKSVERQQAANNGVDLKKLHTTTIYARNNREARSKASILLDQKKYNCTIVAVRQIGKRNSIE